MIIPIIGVNGMPEMKFAKTGKHYKKNLDRNLLFDQLEELFRQKLKRA